jgi:uncharacterized protein with HEPN domain
MRHRIVHDYGRVNIEGIGEVLRRDLPQLIRQLGPLASSEAKP